MDCSEENVDDPSIPSTTVQDAPSGNSGVKRAKGQVQGSAKKPAKFFQQSWLEDPEFKGWLRAVPGDKTAAMCVACNKTLNGGKSDLQKHAATGKHKNSVSSIRGSKSIGEVFAASKSGAKQRHEKNVKEMEIGLAAYFAEHNTAFLCADHLVGVLKKGAHDSQILKDTTLGRQKCSAIVKNVIAKTETEDLVRELQKVPFSVLIDESTDIANDKTMCVLTRHVSPSSSKLLTCILELINLDARDCSAESLWTAFRKCLDKHEIPLPNIVGLACDNASVMTGIRDSFWTRMKAACPSAVLLPCICHSSAIISQNACSTLPSFVLETLRNVSSYLNGSPKRSAELRDFQELYEVELKKVIRPSATRWLVLHSCVQQYIKNADSFTGFFRTRVRENPKDREAQKILKDISYTFTLAYMHFLDYALDSFNEFNALFQSDEILIHSLVDNSKKLLAKLCQNYLKPTEVDRIETVNVSHPSNFMEKVYLGPGCECYLKELSEKPGTNKNDFETEVATLKKNCLNFYITAASDMKKRLPFINELFKQMSFLNPKVLLSTTNRDTFPDLSALGLNFKDVLGLDMNALTIEWRMISREIDAEKRKKLLETSVEDTWLEIDSLKNFKNEKVFPQLLKLARCVMTLPHSNAAAERAFSIVTDVKSKKRNRMGSECLNAIAVTRTSFAARGMTCTTFAVREEHLAKFNQDMYK